MKKNEVVDGVRSNGNVHETGRNVYFLDLEHQRKDLTSKSIIYIYVYIVVYKNTFSYESLLTC